MPEVIIDVGAGKYEYYRSWLIRYPNLRIYSFEPHPDNYDKLLKFRDELTSNSKSRLYVLNQAVHSSSGIKKFYLNNDSNSSSLLPLHDRNVFRWKYPIGRRFFKTIKTIDVECITLKDFFDKNNISSCELLIVDTQGDSLDVLKTLTYNQSNIIKRILVKVHTCGFEVYRGQTDPYDLNQVLRRKYFQVYRCEDYSRGQEQYMYYLNSVMKNRGVTMLDLDGLKTK